MHGASRNYRYVWDVSQVNNELKDVAKARIVAPLNHVFHTVPMADTMFRVALDRVFPGCANLDPPTQPPEADSELNLEQCLSWPMLWPKELIRVDSCFTTPQQNEPFAAQPAGVDHDDNDARVEDFLVDYEEVLPAASEGPLDDTLVAGSSQGHPSCCTDHTEKFCWRRLFSSQGAPEAAPFSPGDPAGLSQDTLQ